MRGMNAARKSVRQSLLLATAFSALVLGGTAAYAQDAAVTPEEEEDTIIVTGSRIPRAGFDTLQPATVIGEEFLEQRAFVNVADALNQLPMFGLPGASNSDDQDSSNIGQNFVNFFGLGSQRTLTLVNGRRFVSSNPPSLFSDAAAGLQVDLNNIPVAMVSRIETVAVGGAPIYGADAIAGTVNVIMKDDFEGVEGSLQYGVAEQGDFATYRGAIVIGGNFADNRGNIIVGIDYSKEEGALQSARPLAGSFQPTPDCLFARCYIPEARVASISRGGVPSNDDFIANFPDGMGGFPFAILDANGVPLAFAPDGTLQPFDFGEDAGVVFANGGDGLDLGGLDSLKAPIERVVVTSFAHYDLTPDITLFGEFFYANSQAHELSNQPVYNSFLFPGTSSNLQFSTDNPFLTPQARDILENVNGLSEFWLARASLDLVGGGQQGNEVNIFRIVGGLEGDLAFGENTYHWDLAYNYGRSRGDSSSFDIDDRAFFFALDAVVDPVTQNIVCDVTLNPPPPLPGGQPDPIANSCAPLNLFGEGAPSQEAINYIFRATKGIAILTQESVAGNFGGPLFSMWAGDVEFAAGFEYRQESGSFEVDGFSQSGLGRGAAIQDIAGEFSSTEYFAEVSVPLISPENNFIFHSASLDAAYRLIDNSRAGADEVYTVGGRLRPIEDIEFRGNVTRSVRAPAIVELFLPLSTTFSFANDPCDASNFDQNPVRQANCEADLGALGVDPSVFQSNVLNASAQGRAGGNPGLVNEVADAWTAGFVLRPRFLPGLTMAVDWVDIELENAIEAATLTNLMEGCYDSQDFPNNFCAGFERDATGQIVDFTTTFANLGFQNFAGATLDATYSMDVEDLPFFGSGAGADLGTLDLQWNLFYLDELDISLSGTDLDIEKGEIDDVEWRSQFNAVYSRGPLEVFMQARYIGEGAFDIEAGPDDQDVFGVDSYWQFNGAVGYDFTDNFGLQLAVNNLLDEGPPDFANASASVYQYDLFGRYWTVRARARF